MPRYDFEDQADYIVIGTGAGGATAARVLSGAGHSVLMLEEGPWLHPEERPRELLPSLNMAVRGAGTATTMSAAPMILLQGKCVGGSTTINSGILWRMPDDVRGEWYHRFGLRDLVASRAQDRIYEQLENELEVSDTRSEILGENSKLMEQACQKLDLPGRPTTRNARQCRGSAQCILGCRGEARQSMDVSYVPRAIRSGARLRDLARARRVIVKKGRAVGVQGENLERGTGRVLGKFRVIARKGVIVAAGAVHTPVILRKSGVRGLVGSHFQAHPGLAVVGRFEKPVSLGFGAAQGYEVPMRSRRYKLESLALPPEMLAARIPGVGREWQQRVAELDHYAQWCVQVRMKAHGSVRPSWWGEPIVRYEPQLTDYRALQEATALLCKMMFAVGATEVYPGLGTIPSVLRDHSEVRKLETAQLKPTDFHLVGSHLFGTARASIDPNVSVVGTNLESHDVKNLYVMDASAFPTNLGVNPQHSIMAVAWRAAEWLT